MRGMVVAALLLGVVPLAGCATTHTRTAKAAERLEHSAAAFAAGTCYDVTTACATGRYVPTARAFADQAREFRYTLDSAGDQQVVSAFERLWRSYHGLRDEVKRLRDRQLQAKLKPTTKAFIGVQRHVKTGYSHADPALYASGGYVFDPIYN